MHSKTILLTGLGFVLLGLGAIGLLLPVWPTTPFILLSFACFSSTPQIRAHIMKFSFFREHIENYERRTGLSRKNIRISMVWLWGMLLISIALLKDFRVIILLALIGAVVTLHILIVAKPRKRRTE